MTDEDKNILENSKILKISHDELKGKYILSLEKDGEAFEVKIVSQYGDPVVKINKEPEVLFL